MNYQVDVIIIGDSKQGHELLDKIASIKPTIKVAFISQAFKSTTTHDYLNVEYFKDEVVHVGYKYRLFGCYLANNDHIYGTHLIVASGLSYEPFVLNNEPVPCVFNNSYDIPKMAKNQPAIVIGDQTADANLAIELSKKYKQVYLCTNDLNFVKASSAVAKKLAKIENLVVLPNTAIRKVIVEDGVLQKVELDNYSVINCSAIYVKTASKPAVSFIPDRLIKKDELGYLVVLDNAESEIVPRCFAIGSCVPKYTKVMEQKLIDTIIKDF